MKCLAACSFSRSAFGFSSSKFTNVSVCIAGAAGLGGTCVTCMSLTKEERPGNFINVARYCQVPNANACSSSDTTTAISTCRFSRYIFCRYISVSMIADCIPPSTQPVPKPDPLQCGAQAPGWQAHHVATECLV